MKEAFNQNELIVHAIEIEGFGLLDLMVRQAFPDIHRTDADNVLIDIKLRVGDSEDVFQWLVDSGPISLN